MKPYLIVLVYFSLLTFNYNDKNLSKENLDYNTIKFEKSDYGLIFTNISVNGITVKAMIDFGDPNVLQLSSSFVSEQNIDVSKSGAIAKDLFGNTFDINEGIAKEVIIGDWASENIKFASSPNEMESVSKQINTKFNAVIGWGYFSQYYTTLNYKENKFELSKKSKDYDKIQYSIDYSKNSNYLSIPVRIEGSKENLIIDTGSPVTVIDSSYYHNNKLKNLELQLGNTLEKVQPYIQNLEMLKPLNAIGIIGGDLLKKYIVRIDPFKKRLTFIK